MTSPLVGPLTKIARVTPTVSASPDYSIDDVLGGIMTVNLLSRGGSGLLHSVSMTCLADIPAGVTIDVLLFDRNPAGSTFTDNGGVAIDPADLPFLVGVVHLTDRIDLGTPAAIQATQLGIPVRNDEAVPANAFYAVAVVRGAATLNLGTTADCVFTFGVIQD